MGGIARPRGDGFFRMEATYQFPPALKDQSERTRYTAGRQSAIGRALLERAPIQILDGVTDPEYQLVEHQKIGQYHSILALPLMREGMPIGVFTLNRHAVRAFSERQIELVTTFADQAAIAIENARLFDEVQARTRELSESLEQQTATSEVLGVISTTTGNLQPVFETLLANATRLCDGNYGAMWLWEGDAFRVAALHGELPPAYIEQWRSGTLFRPGPGVPMARVARTRQPVHVPDMRADPGYLAGDPLPVSVVEVAGVRSLFSVPMLRENEFVGVITIYRKEVRPFTDKQVELVRNFAAQAVIGIENTRVLNELRARTGELARSVEELRALGAVSQAVNSTLDLQTVLDTIVARATQLSGTEAGAIYVVDESNGQLQLRAPCGMTVDMHAD